MSPLAGDGTGTGTGTGAGAGAGVRGGEAGRFSGGVVKGLVGVADGKGGKAGAGAGAGGSGTGAGIAGMTSVGGPPFGLVAIGAGSDLGFSPRLIGAVVRFVAGPEALPLAGVGSIGGVVLVNGLGVPGTARGFINRAAGPEPEGPAGLVGSISGAGTGGTSAGGASSDRKMVKRGLGGWATTAPL